MRRRVFLFATTWLMASAAHAAPAFIPFGAVADAPTGFVDMCNRDPASCALPGQIAPVAANSASSRATSASADLTSAPLSVDRPTSIQISLLAPPPSKSLTPDAPTVAFPAASAMSRAFRIEPRLANFKAASRVSDVFSLGGHALNPLADPRLTDADTIGGVPWRQATTAAIRRNSFTNIKWASLTAAIPAEPAPILTTMPGRLPSLDLVKAINRSVNHRVIQQSDLQTYGVDEYWVRAGERPGASGDCEDIALEKRAELIEAGVAADRLFLAAVFEPRKGLHTVLVARLSAGDYVLDSLERRVVPWNEARFEWLRLQEPDRPREWHRIGNS